MMLLEETKTEHRVIDYLEILTPEHLTKLSCKELAILLEQLRTLKQTGKLKPLH